MILRYAARDDHNMTTTITMIALSGVRWPVSGGRWSVAGVRWPVAGVRWPVGWPVAGWKAAEKVYSEAGCMLARRDTCHRGNGQVRPNHAGPRTPTAENSSACPRTASNVPERLPKPNLTTFWGSLSPTPPPLVDQQSWVQDESLGGFRV